MYLFIQNKIKFKKAWIVSASSLLPGVSMSILVKIQCLQKCSLKTFVHENGKNTSVLGFREKFEFCKCIVLIRFFLIFSSRVFMEIGNENVQTTI